MPIYGDIQNLPRDRGEDGVPVSKNNFVAEQLAEAWLADHIASGGMEYAPAFPERPYRASFAGKRCARQLQYAMAKVPESEPVGIVSAWTMGLGNMVHDLMQNAVTTLFPDAEAEPVVDLLPIGINGSGHADLVMTHNGERVLVELKTVNGFGFKMMTTSFKGKPEGPRFSYVVQAAILAAALGIDKIVIAVLGLEPLSPSLAKKYCDTEAGRFAAEWHYTLDELMPIVRDEVERVNRIEDAISDGILVRRTLQEPKFPSNAEVIDPLSDDAPWSVVSADGSIVDTGSYWGCAYCAWRTRCAADGPDGELIIGGNDD